MAFNQALCGLYAAGLGTESAVASVEMQGVTATIPVPQPPPEILKAIDERVPVMQSPK